MASRKQLEAESIGSNLNIKSQIISSSISEEITLQYMRSLMARIRRDFSSVNSNNYQKSCIKYSSEIGIESKTEIAFQIQQQERQPSRMSPARRTQSSFAAATIRPIKLESSAEKQNSQKSDNPKTKNDENQRVQSQIQAIRLE